MTSKTFKDIVIQKYNDNSFVLTGDTRKYKEDIKMLGGKYNSRLQCGPGWIFSNKSKSNVISFIKNGKRLVSKNEELEGERRTKEWEVKRQNGEDFQENTTNQPDRRGVYKLIQEVHKVVKEVHKQLLYQVAQIESNKKEIFQLKQKIKTLENSIYEGEGEGKGEENEIIFKDSDSDSEEEEEEEVPRKRLLR